MNYVYGFVAAVPTANKEAYRHHAEAAAAKNSPQHYDAGRQTSSG